MKKDGSEIWAAINAYSVNEGGHIQYVISNLVDITYRKEAERKLDLYQKKLRELASELDITEERERREMAEKIHDSIGQTLALMKIKAAMLEDVLDKGRGSDLAGEIIEGLDEVISFTRDFLFEISPPILYELGFESAVRWLGDKMFADHGLVVEYEDDGLFKPMNEDKKAFLFRSLRELLVNVIKHSEVKEVFIRSYLDGDQIILEVEDRGTGFDVEKMYKNLGSSSSYGLFSIRERVNFLGGKMEIYSRENTGTLVSISLPVDENMSGGERHIH
jgi:signal transduction histidine kinase